MKKILSLALLLAMSTAVFASLPVRAEEENEAVPTLTSVSVETTSVMMDDDGLEKITSPDQIKYFKVMKNENGSLYGVRLQANQQQQVKNQANTKMSTSTATSTNAMLEKITSPDQIKYFKVMKKENGALFGIRLQTNSQASGQAVANGTSDNAGNSSTISNVKAQLEKILAPQYIKLYDKVQRVGDSLWGVKRSEMQENNSNEAQETEVKQSARYRTVTAAMSTCVATAIDKKDEALKVRVTATGEEVITAITTRNTCQKQVLQSTDNQQENIDSCNKTFRSSHKTIMEKVKTEQKIIFEAYKTELKACAALDPVATDSDEASELMIEDGGNNSFEVMMQ